MTRKLLAFALLLVPVGALAQTVTPSGAGITSLTGDCTGTGPGATATTCTKTSGVSFGTAATVNTGTSGATIPLLNGANTISGAQINSTASAASTPADKYTGAIFTGGSGTTTFPHVLIQPTTATAATTWDTAGTAFGVNAHTGTNKLIDLRLDGASKFYVDQSGIILNTYFAASSSGLNVYPSNAGFTLSSSTYFAFTSGAQPGTFGDTFLSRAAAGVIAVGATNGAAGDATGSLKMMTATFNTVASDTATADATACLRSSDGLLLKGTGTIGICLGTSSVRYKHDIAPLRAGLAEIMRLRPVSYKLNADHGDPNKTLYGFTAEDMRPVLPKLVGLDGSGKPNSADYLGLVPVLVKAVQQLQGEVEALKAQVASDNLVMAKFNAAPHCDPKWSRPGICADIGIASRR